VKALIQEDDSHGLQMTPLIDVVFLLLVFFLVATTFYEAEKDITIELAEATEGTTREKQLQTVVVNVRSSGIIVINERIHSIDEADAFLSEALDLNEELAVVVRCDRVAAHKHFVRVLNLCEKLGVRNVSVATFEVEDD
jgi:biopolymer transport protein ExbD